MQVAKTFDRGGKRYRPGDPLPDGLDKPTLDHYKRYGMVCEAKPEVTKPTAAPGVTKPVSPRQRAVQGPRQTKQPDLAHPADQAMQQAVGDAAHEPGVSTEKAPDAHPADRPADAAGGAAHPEGGTSGASTGADQSEA